MNIYPIIMAGGSGTRFWPRSRNATPKQILKITSDQFTMIQMAFNLVVDLVPTKNIHVVTNATHAKMVSEQLPNMPSINILQEPCARDTAPCIGLAAAYIHQIDPDAIMLIMPSDHLIKPTEKFHQAVKAAAEIVSQEDTLVTFGITPKYPATAYGYIEKNDRKMIQNGLSVYPVKKFKEKPDENTAKKFVESNQYFWNAGIFVWKAKYILSLFKELMPELSAGLEKLSIAKFSNLSEIYPNLPKISIDFAVMEKAKSVKVIGVDYDWDDIGSWESLINHYAIDNDNNLNKGAIAHLDSKNCIVINDDDKSIITTIGLDNLLIVKSGNAILIADRNKGQDIKKLIEELKIKKLNEFL